MHRTQPCPQIEHDLHHLALAAIYDAQKQPQPGLGLPTAGCESLLL